MGLTAYAQEEKAKREAWYEMGKLRKRIAELEKGRAVRDLRQQAKGLADFFNKVEPYIGVAKPPKYVVTRYSVVQAIEQLNKQADELEQELANEKTRQRT